MASETGTSLFGFDLPYSRFMETARDDASSVAERTAQMGQFMAPFWRRFGAVHKAVYLASGGQIGSSLFFIPMLLLSTRGRRSGLVRTMPLAYLPDPQDPETCVVVASNGGSRKPPSWWLNLSAEPAATVQVATKNYWVRATEAPAERRGELWRSLRRAIPPYQLYEKIEREIPIVLLQPIPAGEDLARVRE
jgi:deazaflavin-dependent oxidoreductase (nitroreductase family)